MSSKDEQNQHKGFAQKLAELLQGSPPHIAVQVAEVAAASALETWRRTTDNLPPGSEVESEIRRLALATMDVCLDEYKRYFANREGTADLSANAGKEPTTQQANERAKD
jgi:hypothetical protein